MSRDNNSIGSILVGMGFITDKQLLQVLKEQENEIEEIPLGEFLIDAGFITYEQLKEALRFQIDLNSKKRTTRAKASAVMAKQSSVAVVQRANNLRIQSEELRVKGTGRGFQIVGNLASIKAK